MGKTVTKWAACFDYDDRLVCHEIECVETLHEFRVLKCHSFLRWRTRISKDEHFVFDTRDDALAALLKKIELNIRSHTEDLSKCREQAAMIQRARDEGAS